MNNTYAINYACYGTWTQAMLNININPIAQFQCGANKDSQDKTALHLLESNYPSVPIKHEQADIVVGSPPCINFSHANPNRRDDAPSNQHFVNAFEYANIYAKKAFLFEIVPPAITSAYYPIANKKASRFNIAYTIVDISEYGSAQKRTRAYILGIEHKYNKHAGLYLDKFIETQKRPFIHPYTILHKVEAKYNKVPEDNRVKFSYYRTDGEKRAGAFNTLSTAPYYIPEHAPTRTIVGASCYWQHWNRKRMLAAPEVAMLMGLPESYINDKGNPLVKCDKIAKGVDVRFTSHLLEYLNTTLFTKLH